MLTLVIAHLCAHIIVAQIASHHLKRWARVLSCCIYGEFGELPRIFCELLRAVFPFPELTRTVNKAGVWWCGSCRCFLQPADYSYNDLPASSQPSRSWLRWAFFGKYNHKVYDKDCWQLRRRVGDDIRWLRTTPSHYRRHSVGRPPQVTKSWQCTRVSPRDGHQIYNHLATSSNYM